MIQITTQIIRLRLTGIRPLIMARGESANPFDEQARQIKSVSQKRKKTDEDYELLTRLQFESSLYWDEKIGPYIPTDNLWKCMQEGAAKYKETSLVKSRVSIRGLVGKEEDAGAAQLIYSGPRDLAGLYTGGFCYLKMGKLPSSKTSILISRAKFDQWAVDFIVEYEDIDTTRIVDYWKTAGRMVGIGAWRLRHGLFIVEVLK